jgi:tetratricopeptide (TPR) repeat protein
MPSRRANSLLLIAAVVLAAWGAPVRAQFYWSQGIKPDGTEKVEIGKLVFGEYNDEQKRISRSLSDAQLARMDRERAQRGTAPEFMDEYAVLLCQSGRLEQAERVWLELLKAHPDHATAWFNLSVARQTGGRYEAARDALLNGLELKPGFRAGAEDARVRMLDFLIATRSDPAYARDHLFLDELTPAWRARTAPPDTFAAVKFTTTPLEAVAGLMRGFHQFGDGWLVLGMLLENRGDLHHAKIAYQNAMKFGSGQAAELRPYLTALAAFESSTNPVRFAGRRLVATLVFVVLLVVGLKGYRVAKAVKEDREEARRWQEEQVRLKKNADGRRFHGGPK